MMFVECLLPSGAREYFVGTDQRSLMAYALGMKDPSYQRVKVVEREEVERYQLKYFEKGVQSVTLGRSKTYLLGTVLPPEAADTK